MVREEEHRPAMVLLRRLCGCTEPRSGQSGHVLTDPGVQLTDEIIEVGLALGCARTEERLGSLQQRGRRRYRPTQWGKSLRGSDIFQRFVSQVRSLGYSVAWSVCHGVHHAQPAARPSHQSTRTEDPIRRSREIAFSCILNASIFTRLDRP